uniref:Uncharacterized protein n=1 Tax=Cacopsylla melanoneura TaxID=428564 RepID=A0A8D9BKJ7_9HEMI
MNMPLRPLICLLLLRQRLPLLLPRMCLLRHLPTHQPPPHPMCILLFPLTHQSPLPLICLLHLPLICHLLLHMRRLYRRLHISLLHHHLILLPLRLIWSPHRLFRRHLCPQSPPFFLLSLPIEKIPDGFKF